MSKLSPNIKPYTLDETVSIMNPECNCGLQIKTDVWQAQQIIHQLLVQIIDDNKMPCEFTLYGKLTEGDIDDTESEAKGE
jgi:hypothetical protein